MKEKLDSVIIGEFAQLSNERMENVDTYCKEICKVMEDREFSMTEALLLVTILLMNVGRGFVDFVTNQEDMLKAAEKAGIDVKDQKEFLKYTEDAAVAHLGQWLNWMLARTRTLGMREILDA
jgi:hypothetical protein